MAVRTWQLVSVGGFLVIVAGVFYLRTHQSSVSTQDASRQSAVGCRQVGRAFQQRESGVWLVMDARVTRILGDSYGTYQHQRFIVTCPSGQTVLVTNDVDVGTRVPVTVGSLVGVRGQYIWNGQGGLVHYTHHGGAGEGGWILFGGRLYSLGPARSSAS